MAGQIRQSRIATAIKKFVSTLMLSEYGDSPVSMITISKVTVMPDLRSAKIFYSTFDSGSVDKIQEYLDLKTKNIRFKLASHLKTLKFAPEIKFVYDDSVEKIIRLEKIFDSIKSDQNGSGNDE
ncbi:MAG TPA: 30S ribosome-binding factor RbfA [bacterium]|jgi:ribosome-binding factor A|nr:30S ribosome-binding factor RbfA [bacterium]HOB71294.1 30S ribosome-binding factor RbfA [bacterium]HPM46435.1 30S ribosome-binding factor RbfA [bacterium]HPV21808.1 30S ribosome-binding factor RbfA [bacterium]HPY13936.1 30S ribosome-binding factor RbfA [bacterium]